MTDLRKTSGCVICIDLKSFYASVECADRSLDPFTTNLVVADPDRSANTICLAITPAMKAAGVRNRCRVRDIPPGIEYLTAVPRMKRYMQVSGEIVGSYLELVSPQDLQVYSIDECFINAAPYLHLYRTDARTLAKRLMRRAFEVSGVTATAGIGSNMFQAKVALDICAKHASDGIGQLDDESFKREIWFHRPITDIWGIGPGIARRLAKHGAYDLAGVCAVNPKVLRREFGKNAEYLIDHAWGLEACTVEQARSYRPRGHSLTNGQVLMRDYSYREVETLLREMVLGSALELVEKGLCAQVASVYVGVFGQQFPPPIVGEVRAVRRRGHRRGRVGKAAQAHQRRGRADRRRAGNLPRPRDAGAFHPPREHSVGGPDARQQGAAHAVRRRRERAQAGRLVAGHGGRTETVRRERAAESHKLEGGGERHGAQQPGRRASCLALNRHV